MRKILIAIRNFYPVNLILRNLLFFLNGKFRLFVEKKCHQIRAYGLTKNRLAEVDFLYYSFADDNTANSIFYKMGWEKNESTVLSKLAAKCDCIVDVGANTGAYSILFSKSNPTASIHAFEPHEGNFLRLEKNVKVNGLKNVLLLKQAVGSENKKIKFTVPTDQSISNVSSAVNSFTKAYYNKEYKEVEVDQICLDSYCLEKNIQPQLVKVDVEYYEFDVLLGMKTILEKFEPVLMLEIFVYDFLIKVKPELENSIDKDLSDKIESFLKDLGYYFYMFNDHGLYRVDSINTNPDKTNYLFSKVKSKSRFMLYSSDELFELVKHKN